MITQTFPKLKFDTTKLPRIFQVYRRFFIVVFLSILVMFIVTQVIKGTIDQISQTQITITEQEVKLAGLTEKESLLQGIDKEMLNQQEKKLDEAIPPTINLPLILATLQKLAQDSEVELGEFSISSSAQVVSIIPIQQADKLSSFQFDINLTGDFEKVKRFTDLVPTVLPMFSVDKIVFSQNNTKATINFYFQPKGLAQKLVVDAPLPKFADTHTEAINDVSKLTPPVFEDATLASDAGVIERENPFR